MTVPSPEEKAANISIRGAWGVAAVTVLGSLVISVITGIITGQQTAANTERQIKAASIQSQSEYLQQQRQTIYGKFLSDVTVNQQCQYDLEIKINGEQGTSKGRFDLTPINQALTNCDTLGDNLGQELGSVSLVSPGSISNQAQNIWNSLSKSYTSLAAYVQDIINHSASAAAGETAWISDFDPVNDMLTKLTNAMKSVTYGD